MFDIGLEPMTSVVGGQWWEDSGGRTVVGGQWWEDSGGKTVVGGQWWEDSGGRTVILGTVTTNQVKLQSTFSSFFQ